MKPVKQTTFGTPGGNCFSACVASILELDIEEVPYFMGEKFWTDTFGIWLSKRKLWYLDFDWNETLAHAHISETEDVYCIGTGDSSRGWEHSVILQLESKEAHITLYNAHDPMPGGEFLTKIKSVGFIIPKY